jgi:hypothetical protein
MYGLLPKELLKRIYFGYLGRFSNKFFENHFLKKNTLMTQVTGQSPFPLEIAGIDEFKF